MAELSLASTRVMLRRPLGLQEVPSEATVNIVRVWETDTPPGEPAVEWVLLTSEPVDTLEQVAQVVDWYRARWTIEEYFKALKTGCAIEQRQLESYDALVIALAISIPIAWRLLLLRSQARERADALAASVLNDVQLQIVATKAKVPASNLTLHLALLAIAQMGGHLKHNGEPGWQALWHGYEKLLLLEQGWRAARAADCDQS
jgi:Transposase DDE domain